MIRNTLLTAVAAALFTLLTPGESFAFGARHVGYTHVGPSGVYHAGRTEAYGPGGYHASGSAYHAGASGAGGYRYGATAGANGGAYHAGAYGAGSAGGYRYGTSYGAAGGVYRRW